MSELRRFLSSSVGTKVVIAVTGLALSGFLVTHLAGNLLVFAGPPVFNGYAHKLAGNKAFLWLAEAGLGTLFGIHVYKTVRMTLANRRARPRGYVEKRLAGAPSRKGLASSAMIWTGLSTLVFILLHLRTFKFGPWYVAADGSTRDLHRLVVEVFSRPGYVVFYALAMAVLGTHLRHGVGSAFQSLGIDHPRATPTIRHLALAVALAISLGFAAVPVALFLVRVGP